MKLRLMLFAFIAFAMLACSKDESEDYCYQSTLTGIDFVTGPDTTTVDEPVELEVTFGIGNGCGKFIGFVESNGFPKQVSARVDYVGCVCTELFQIAIEPYTFQASQPGEYELKFVTPAGGFISKTITVTEQ